ncbi:hypothetical protein HJG60_008488 [Phyllostomus discolor]|uniref:Uncharacterized protein n=1 Tax=Phyllostomus discolor TaxID=89673 RepID=A0A833Z8J2_9CHIR|nr:hypothetical protein HJG60_008488 [Phyllostomus discolor]
MVESREAHVQRGFSVHPSERQKSAFPVTVQLQASPINLCLVRQVPAQLHELSPYTPPSHMASSSLSTHMASSSPNHMASPYIPDLLAEFPSLSAHPHFKCSSQKFLHDLISNPSYDVLLLPVPPYLLPSFSYHL